MALDAEAKAVVLDLVVPFRPGRDDGRSGWDAEQGLKHAAKIGISRPLPSTRFQSDGIGGERFKSLPGDAFRLPPARDHHTQQESNRQRLKRRLPGHIA
jgi:hypothetical protein